MDVRPYIQIELIGRKFLALMDTGSVIDLVGVNVANYLKDCDVRPDSCKVSVRLANGASLEVKEIFQLEGKIGQRDYTWEAFYMPTLTADLVIGINTIRNLNLISFNRTTTESNEPDTHISDVDSISLLSEDEKRILTQFLTIELQLFKKAPGRTNLLEHVIKLKENISPVKQRHYPRNPAMQEVINTEIDTMLKDDVIEESNSPWSSPIVLIKKPSGKYRFCIDFRKVNNLTEKDAYPLPRINTILEKLKKAKFISTLDLQQGYWQVPLSQDSRALTAFTVPGKGLYQFKVMPFGLHSAGATFQRLLDKIIGVELEPKAFCYLDDLIVVSETFGEHVDTLKLVFRRLRDAGLKLNPEKCHFFKTELKYLGHVVNQQGISTDPDKVKAIEDFPRPENVRNLRSFLGLASWYRRFTKDFAIISRPLTKMLRKNQKWTWGPAQEAAFAKLKNMLSTTPVLACPDFTQPFTLQVDASNEGLGASLTQKQDKTEVVIAYASRLLTDSEKNFTTTEKECLALVWAVRKFRPYIEGYHFIAITDHAALKWLMGLQEPTGRLARWIMELQQHDFVIQYRKGAHNRVADALSRQPVKNLQEAEGVTVIDKQDVVVVETQVKVEERDWVNDLTEKVVRNPVKFPKYCIREGKLYRACHIKGERQQSWVLCIPPDLKGRVLEETHDSPLAGHFGVKKTIARVREKYYWPRWQGDVRNYVRSCKKCQEYKVSQEKPAGQMHFRDHKGPWYAISADIVGPLPRSRKGNRYILAFQDLYSKWTELSPMGSASAKNVAVRFKELILCRYGAPETVITDNGTQFVSKLFKDLTLEWGIKNTYTAPYSPQSNPVERQNRVIKTMIAQFVGDDHRSWDVHLSELQYAMNTAQHDSTSYTPAILCYGRELKHPRCLRDVPFETHVQPDGRSIEQVHLDRMEDFKERYYRCQRNLRAAYNRQSKYYNLRRRDVKFEPNTLVLRRVHQLSSALDDVAGKLAPKFKGPYRVMRRKGNNIYEVKEDASSKIVTVHVKDLKVFHPRDLQ